MFQRLHELSQCLPERPAWERLNEGMPDNYDRGLAVTFDEQGCWVGVKSVTGNQGVVYRSGPPNGTDLTPCCKLAGNTANRLLGAVANLAAFPELPERKRAWLSACLEEFGQRKDEIWAAVETAQQQAGVNAEHRGYVFVAAAPSLERVYAWPETRDFLVSQSLERFADKGGARKDGHCAVCNGSAAVYGNYSVLACYNLDKPGSIAGGFSASNAHRNLPVCGQCALAVADAFTFAETYLTSSMGGQSYLVLPYANAPAVREELTHALREHPDRYRLGSANDLLAAEMELVKAFQGSGDQLAFALVFFKAENAAWRIQAEVQQVLPSRLRILRNAARKIARAADLTTETKEETKPLAITAMTFKNFAGVAEKTSAETFRGWLVALFEGQPIDSRHFLHHLVAKLVHTGKAKPDLLHWMTLQAWGLYRYAVLTGLIQINPTTSQQDALMQAVTPASAYGRYIQEHGEFFNAPELVVAFLTGCYAAQVASVQRQERGADPFTKKFIGRLLPRTHLQRLYREGHGKLAQYGKLAYVIKDLDPDLAAAWVACGERWTISDEQATFAFTLGYSLAYRIRQLDSENSENSDDNE
ncbi:MAG: CRISPR-associated protein [Gammaproteobacteria bacterium]|nr:CRISPR-associated protein [Gammaproteobacteria bacterium]